MVNFNHRFIIGCNGKLYIVHVPVGPLQRQLKTQCSVLEPYFYYCVLITYCLLYLLASMSLLVPLQCLYCCGQHSMQCKMDVYMYMYKPNLALLRCPCVDIGMKKHGLQQTKAR